MKINHLIGIILTSITCMAAPNLVFDGSERLATLPWKLLAIMPSGNTTTNFSSTGKTGAQMLASTNFDTRIAPLGSGADAIVFEMPAADLANGVSVATFKSNMTNYYNKANSAFPQVFILPILPRGSDASNYTEANRTNINYWASTNYPASFVPTSYDSRIYGSFDHSWANYTAGNPWFLDASHLDSDGSDYEAITLRHKEQKEFLIPTADPTVTTNAFNGVQITGIVGNKYLVKSTLDKVHGPWDTIDTVILATATEYWVDMTGALNRFYEVKAATVE